MSQILIERTAGRAVITLDRSAKLNSLSTQMKNELEENLESLAKDEQLRVMVLTGTGDAFCAGTDINELSIADETQAIAISRAGQEICNRIEQFPVPVIAAVNGLAAGGGFELVLACHLRVAATTANFSLPETWLGLIPGYGGTQRLAREIGMARAIEWMLTRKTITGTEALEFGLINRLVTPAELRDESISLANEIEQLSPLSIRACLAAVSQGIKLPLEDGLKLETKLFASLFNTDDAKEGTSAFLEKRRPVFKGR